MKMKHRTFTLLALTCATAINADAILNSVCWPIHANEIIKIYKQHGGNADDAMYATYDFDNDGQEELVVYDYRSEDDTRVCVFAYNESEGLQLVTDNPDAYFYYIPEGEGAYTILQNEDFIYLINSTARKGDTIGDGDNMCLEYHGRRKEAVRMTWGNPLSLLNDQERNYDMTPYKGVVSPTNFSRYWYRNQPKVKGGVGIVSFFNAICEAINMPMLQNAQKAVAGTKTDDAKVTIDPAAGYLQWIATNTSEEDEKPNRIECTYWKRPEGKHIVALNYHINLNEEYQWGAFRNIVFWEYDAQTSSLIPINEPAERMWMLPNLNYNIDVELPRKGRDIKITDNETGEESVMLYQYDENLITFYHTSVIEETHLPWAKGLMCSIYDTTGTPTNIRMTPAGKKCGDTMGPNNLVIDKQEKGYFHIVGDMLEDWTDECDNVQYLYGDHKTGYWIHHSCLAVKSRHINGAPLHLYKDWDDCNIPPISYTLKSETILRPIDITKEGWVKVQTLDGKHSGWTTKDKLGACVME